VALSDGTQVTADIETAPERAENQLVWCRVFVELVDVLTWNAELTTGGCCWLQSQLNSYKQNK